MLYFSGRGLPEPEIIKSAASSSFCALPDTIGRPAAAGNFVFTVCMANESCVTLSLHLR